MYHIITGNGKGKTTAALGMALRAAGAGMQVFIAQFVKGKQYAEHNTIAQLPNISCELMGRRCFIKNEPEQEDIDTAREGWQKVIKRLEAHTDDLLILDELHIALYYKLIDASTVLKVIKAHQKQLEIVSTGRYAADALIEAADLVSEIREVKHYYQQGTEARKGIEY